MFVIIPTRAAFAKLDIGWSTTEICVLFQNYNNSDGEAEKVVTVVIC